MIDVDAIIVISLKHREDRRAVLEPQLRRAIAEGVLPDLPIEYVNRFPYKGIIVPTSWADTPGYYGATLEHQAVLRDLFQRKVRNAFIFEDDAKLRASFFSEGSSFFGEVQRRCPHWQGMFFGGRDQKGKIHVGGEVWRNKGCLGSHAYVINQQGIQSFYDQLNHGDQVVDWAYATVMGKIPQFFSPEIYQVGTQSGWSDNMNQFVAEE
jgi:hypothetical protein